jgi:hypothetical protein
MNKILILGLIVCSALLFGCIGQDAIVGCWEYKFLGTTSEMIFNSNGTFSIDSPILKSEGTWKRLDFERIIIERTNVLGKNVTEIIYFDEKSKTITHQDLPDAKFYSVECTK